MRKYYLGILIINIIVITLVVAGFVIGGTPGNLKEIGYDTTRISSFSNIKYSIQAYYRTYFRLPNYLTDIIISPESLRDPQTKELFTYTKESSMSYKLCAKFSTNAAEVKAKYAKDYYPGVYNYAGVDENEHKKGFDCMSYTVDVTK